MSKVVTVDSTNGAGTTDLWTRPAMIRSTPVSYLSVDGARRAERGDLQLSYVACLTHCARTSGEGDGGGG